MKNETTADKKQTSTATQADKTSAAIKTASGKALEVQDTAGAVMPDTSAVRGSNKEDAESGFNSQADAQKASAKK